MIVTRILLKAALIALMAGCIVHPLLADSPAQLIDEAWKAWEQGDEGTAEAKFNEAIGNDPATNARAHLGLSILFNMQRHYQMAWHAYRSAYETFPNPAPYLYAAWTTPRMRMNMEDKGMNVLSLVQDLAEHGDSLGVLRAMAHERLIDHFRNMGRMSTALKEARAMGCITDWMVIGPFDNISASGQDKVFPPEQEFRPDAKYSGKNGIPAWWFRPAAMRVDNWVDFTRYFSNSNAVFYANTFIYSPTRQTVSFRVGTSGSFKAFLNDELVNEEAEEYDNGLDTYIAETELQQGWNRVLIKCGYSEIRSCNFMLRLTDASGNPLENLKVSTDPQLYPNKPGATSKRSENFAEQYFRDQITRHPDYIENYLLLADVYLQNDKGIEAELILRDALKISPNAPAVYDRLVDAYQRVDKGDEAEQALEKIYSVDKDAPVALEHKFAQYVKTEDYEKAEGVVDRFERILPGSLDLYRLKIALYARRDLRDKVIAVTQEAYEKYPLDPDIAQAYAGLLAQAAQKPEEAIKFYQHYLDQVTDVDVMHALARLYLSQSDIGNWRRMYDRLIEMSPASPGYYQYLANNYFTMRKYDEAEKAIRRALDLCPNSSSAWSKLGEIHRIQGNTNDAKNDYAQALVFSPTDYDARAMLRELQGKRSIFEQFAPLDVDSVIAYAHHMHADPDDGAVILLDRAQHVVYGDNGASEAMQEMVVKVLNNRGIDDWKEYVLPVNRYNEELIVEKAVVVKDDGTETNADVNDNYVVFKSLQENDVLHIKWRVKNHYAGKLASHFFDSYQFNGFYPEKHVRYELIVPKDYKFEYRAQNMKVEPRKSDVPDGVLYQWTMDTIPPISYEYGMPPLEDVASMLFISSIESWEYLVDWYSDVASAKSRGSYEIKEQVKELLKGKENASDDEKMSIIYNFITENIRYSSVAFRQGAYIPQKARDVLVNKIGDCKDVATLCIAMLREAGLKAHYVLVNTRDEGQNRNALPAVVFNHCIVEVETGGGQKFLDLTANNYPVGSIPEGDMDAFALVISPGVKQPVYLPHGSVPRNVLTRSTFRLGADNSMSGHCSTTASGTIAASVRDYFRDQPKKEQEKKLLAGLGTSYTNVKLRNFSFENLDNIAPSASYAYDFDVPDYLAEAGTFRILKMPWSHPAESNRAFSYEKRELPYDYWPAQDTLTEELTIQVPDGYMPIELPGTIHLSSKIADYTLTYSYSGGTLSARRQVVGRKRGVETDEYTDVKAFQAAMVKEDSRLVLLQRKAKR
ncbi:MAG: DUF3857 domain-containing protein [Bacteroidetes bacterium]|nr:DUF3857 domain-containing protein [Bacteroidota bacterium]